MARWIVWFCETYEGNYSECVGSDSTFPVDGRKSINTIIRDIKKNWELIDIELVLLKDLKFIKEKDYLLLNLLQI